jgi:DNA-binding CsgD family transcriptional regulator
MRLDVYEGSHRRSVTVDADLIRVGRDPDCDVPLPDPTVSRVHATFTLTADGWVIADSTSRNGTYLNGRRLTEPAPLRPADRVLIGSFVLVPQPADTAVVETVGEDDAAHPRVQVETGLSAREVEVLRLVCAGDSDQQIADTLFISIKTVQSHLDRIRTKTGCRRRAELLRFGIDHGVA